jgi:hypothetical protein
MGAQDLGHGELVLRATDMVREIGGFHHLGQRGGDDLRLCPDGLGIKRLRLRRLGATLSDRPVRLLELVSFEQRQEQIPLAVEVLELVVF